MSASIDTVPDAEAWRPLTRQTFGQLRRGARLRERNGRTWTLTGGPFAEHGHEFVVIRSGDLVRRVQEHFADAYMVVSDDPGEREAG